MANILVIDDSPDFLLVLSEILRLGGHQVATAMNGKEGLRLFEVGNFDLVITDIVMPEQEGIETITKLRSRTPRPKIIAMSGGGHGVANHYLKMAQYLGASRTLTKPFTGAALLEAVASVLAAE